MAVMATIIIISSITMTTSMMMTTMITITATMAPASIAITTISAAAAGTATTIIIAIDGVVVVVDMAAMALGDRSGGRPRFLGVGDDTIAYIVRLEANDRRLCAGVVDGTAKLVAELAVDDDKSIMKMR